MKKNMGIISLIIFFAMIFSSCNLKIYGTYQISAAYSLVHDQSMKEIETEKKGEIIKIGLNTAIFENVKYSISDRKKDFGWRVSSNKINYAEFCVLFVGLNYESFDVSILDPNFKWETGKKLERNVIIRALKTDEYRYTVFFANNKLIIDGYENEFKALKDWDIDNFFYIAEKIK